MQSSRSNRIPNPALYMSDPVPQSKKMTAKPHNALTCCSTMPAIPASAVRQVVGLQRAADKRLLAHDIEMVGRRVKDDLFENVVFIFTKSALDVGKPLYNDFIANCKSLFTGEGGALAGASDADVMSYMKILWNEMTSMRSYFGWFTQKRSNKLQAIENGFHSKCLHSICASVPVLCIWLTHLLLGSRLSPCVTPPFKRLA